MKSKTMLTTLLRSIPSSVTALFIFAVVTMNLLSRITLLSLPWLALNAGILISWLSFLLLDIVTKHFGAKAANMLSIVAIAVNLLCSFICVVISRVWDYPALDMVVGGQWSILLASTVAYIISALTNNYTNVFIGKKFVNDPDGKTAFAVRSFVSTFLSQILDNFIFVFLAFVMLPNIPGAFQVRWTLQQCIGCSVSCAVLELISEMIFSPLGYRIVNRWKAENVGEEYISKFGPGALAGE